MTVYREINDDSEEVLTDLQSHQGKLCYLKVRVNIVKNKKLNIYLYFNELNLNTYTNLIINYLFA